MQLNFDATKYAPEQSNFTKHPIGQKFQAVISATGVKENNKKDGGYFEVTFTTPAGMIPNRYNLFFASPDEGQKKSQEIANKQLSALCHAVGIFKLGTGAELVGARLLIDVDWQKNNAPTPEKPEGGYTEVTKVYDANGNEPGKAPAQQQAQPAAAQGGWSGQQAPLNNAPANAPAPANSGGWTPGPSAQSGAPVPWGQK